MRRRNPPLSESQIDDPSPRGGECVIFAIAAATGRSVGEVRKAILEIEDLWDRDGIMEGTPIRLIRPLLEKLDVYRKIAEVGFAASGEAFRTMRSVVTGYALPPEERGFELKNYMITVGQGVRHASLNRFAMIGMNLYGARGRRRAHLVGYSPSKGFFDTASDPRLAEVPKPRVWEGPPRDEHAAYWRSVDEKKRSREIAAAQKFADEKRAKGLPWFAWGNEVPSPNRKLHFWLMFKGE